MGLAPLHWAAAQGHLEAAQALLNWGASVTARCSLFLEDGQVGQLTSSPASPAALCVTCALALRGLGAAPAGHVLGPAWHTPCRQGIQRGRGKHPATPSPPTPPLQGPWAPYSTPLHMAAAKGDGAMVHLLLTAWVQQAQQAGWVHAGPDPRSLRDFWDRRPMDVAHAAGHRSVLGMLSPSTSLLEVREPAGHVPGRELPCAVAGVGAGACMRSAGAACRSNFSPLCPAVPCCAPWCAEGHSLPSPPPCTAQLVRPAPARVPRLATLAAAELRRHLSAQLEQLAAQQAQQDALAAQQAQHGGHLHHLPQPAPASCPICLEECCPGAAPTATVTPAAGQQATERPASAQPRRLVAAAGCRHALCVACARRLCCMAGSRRGAGPVRCPLCRGVIAGWAPAAQALAAAE